MNDLDDKIKFNIWTEGLQAQASGSQLYDNPYQNVRIPGGGIFFKLDAYFAWRDGWLAGRDADRAAKFPGYDEPLPPLPE